MPFVTYAGMGAALAVVGFVIAFSNVPINQPPPELPLIPIANLEAIGSTTPFRVQLEALVPSPDILPALDQALSAPTTTSSTTTAPVITPPQIPKRPAPAPLPDPAPIAPVPTLPTTPELISTPVPAPEPEPQTPEDTALAKLRAASVNILCTSSGGTVRSASGSGVIIDSRGIIMTVAHIAQYHLLYDYPSLGSISCVIRTGSPASRAYVATPIYVSERWIKKNPATLVTQAPVGSGEDDYAFLAITGSATGGSLPSSFSYVPLGSSDPKKGDDAVIAAYPAQTLTSTQIHTSLSLVGVTSSIKDRYTFDATSVDLISLGGSEVAQTGSSGGGVSSIGGLIIGLITTSSTDGPYASRNLHAITPNHIRRSFKADTGENLDSYLSGPIANLTRGFEDTALELRTILINAIED